VSRWKLRGVPALIPRAPAPPEFREPPEKPPLRPRRRVGGPFRRPRRNRRLAGPRSATAGHRGGRPSRRRCRERATRSEGAATDPGPNAPRPGHELPRRMAGQGSVVAFDRRAGPVRQPGVEVYVATPQPRGDGPRGIGRGRERLRFAKVPPARVTKIAPE
jgi:hypothetical protein